MNNSTNLKTTVQTSNSLKKTIAYNIITVLVLLFSIATLHAQHTNEIIAKIDTENHLINIQQTFSFQNSSDDPLNELYFNDWNNAYSSKNTPLAKRFSEEFKKSLHLASNKDRGFTSIIGIIDGNYQKLSWERLDSYDIIKIDLREAVQPSETVKLILTYTVKLPHAKFTSYGHFSNGSYNLKDWYLSPAIYSEGDWLLYSNLDLQDLYTGVTNTVINFVYPQDMSLNSNYSEIKSRVLDGQQWVKLVGNRQKGAELFLEPVNSFKRYQLKNTVLVTDLIKEKMDQKLVGESLDRVIDFIYDKLGPYPHDQLLITSKNNERYQIYGLNLLPSFLSPYSESFVLELNLLKTTLYTMFNESFFINPRKEQWVNDAIVNYLMIRYVETYYPDTKLLGRLADFKILKGFYASQIKFNDKYALLYNYSARKNLNQALLTSNDSLIKFNNQIANKYKAGLGLSYLSEYLGDYSLDQCIEEFYNTYKQSEISGDLFREVLENFTQKDISWFFEQYIFTNNKINFKIDRARTKSDSTEIRISSNKNNKLPISLFGLKKDSIVFKKWITPQQLNKKLLIKSDDIDRVVLNYDHKIPEINPRDNWKSVNGFLSTNRRLRMTFFKDIENPYRSQLFYFPNLKYNLYDGFTPGMRLHNKTPLDKAFEFSFYPSYSLATNSWVGFGTANYNKYYEKPKLYYTNFSIGYSSFHFDRDARYSTLVPIFSMGWRPSYLRKNKTNVLYMRYVNVNREYDKSSLKLMTPNYGVFNIGYGSLDRDALNYFKWKVNSEFSTDFSKLNFEVETRKLYDNKQQLNFRLYLGTFLHNNTDGNFFSYALDRPTDYLFEYPYLGRSEEEGIYSQQLIIAEGGFKSKLSNPYANQWLGVANTSLNVWRWIELYNDVGFVKNKGSQARLVYDFGVRMNLVTDYLELYFPLYSNNGWELTQNEYSSKIRFVFSLNPKTLSGLFKRQWF